MATSPSHPRRAGYFLVVPALLVAIGVARNDAAAGPNAAAQGGAKAQAADDDTPARRSAQRFLRGVNLSNCLEAPPGQDWGAHYAAKDLDDIRAQGFDHVRIPVAWHHYAGPAPDFALAPDIFKKVDALVDGATQRHLAVIVNLQHFDAFTSDPGGNRTKLLSLWRQIAAHYAKAPDGVAFELLNEPKDAATTAVMSGVYPEIIAVIRKTNPNRTIFVGPGRWNQAGELEKLKLPDAERNLIVTVHCYEPFNFTHQGATWAGEEVKSLQGIMFPGPPKLPFVPAADAKLPPWTLKWIADYNTLPTATNPCGVTPIRDAVKVAQAWSKAQHRPVHFGEFGAIASADPASRARYYRTVREELDRAGIGWAIWDWKSGFRYRDEKTAKALPGMHEALFPGRKESH